jgi:membrane fusion protein, macrolide-specific efflux system
LRCIFFRASCRAALWLRTHSRTFTMKINLKRIPGEAFRTVLVLGPFLLVMLCPWTNPLHTEASSGEQKTGATEIVFQGKLYCSLSRNVVMPFLGTIQELKVMCGQSVAEGAVLAGYQLAKESVALIRRRLSPPQIGELEMRLAGIDRDLSATASKRREIEQLAAEKMASAQSLALVEQEIILLEKERATVQERLRQERGCAKEDIALLKHQLAVRVEADQVPASGALVSPIAGSVIWVSPDLKGGAEIAAGTPSFVIGVMNPMLMRAQVHEIEAVRLSLGDRAEISIESMPDLKVEGAISRLSWSPKTPGLEQPTYYEIELTVANPGRSIRDGLKAEAVIRTRESKDQK